MSITYEGPLRHRIKAWQHEGYTDPADGGGVSARCSCGWHGSMTHVSRHSPDDAEDAAYSQWETEHLQPMLDAEADQYTVPLTELLNLAQRFRRAAATEYRDENGHTSDRGMGMFDASGNIDELVEQLVETNPASTVDQWRKEAGWL